MRVIFAIDSEAIARFPQGSIVCDRDRRGEPVRGRVIEVKPGNKVAIVIIETEPAGSGMENN